MARQVLPWVGAAVGFVVSGGNPMGAQAGFALGSLIGNAVDPIEVQGNKLGDSPTQTAAEGGARAIVFGKGCIRSTCVLERGGRRVIKQRDSSGGKGGSPTTVNERALWTYAIGLGEPIKAVLRIWEDEKLVYDVTPESTIPADSAAFAQKFRFYDGSEDQLPDPAIEAIYSDPDDAPYYRGTAYIVFPQRDLTDFGERVPTYRVEVASLVEVQSTNGVVALGFATNTVYDSTYSVDGSVWSDGDRGIPGGSATYVVGIGDRFVAWDLVNAWYSDDGGETWTLSDGNLGGTGGARFGCARGDTVLVAGFSGIYRSTDRGESFSAVSGSPGCGYVSAKEGLAVAVSINGTAYAGSEDGGSWGSGVATGVNNTGGKGCLRNDGETFLLGGTDDGVPVLKTSTDGVAWANRPLPYTTSTYVRGTAGGRVGGKMVWVAGTDTGELFYSEDGDDFQVANDSLGAQCNDIVFNGRYFIAAGGSSNNGVIKTSVDGKNWVSRSQPLAYAALALGTAEVNSSYVADNIPLSTIVAALHDLAGHSPDDYDVSELTDQVVGITIEQTVTAAEAINSIIGTHWADPTEYDGKIRYIKRGKPVVKTLTADDLIDEPETWQRNNAIEYPAKVHFFGQIAEAAYAPIKATHTRYSTEIRSQVVGEASVSSPETFNDSVRPHEIAAILHKILWTEAGGEITWRVTDEHMDLVPSDCVGLSWRGQLARARIVQIEDDPGERKLKMKLDRQSAYTANLTEIPVPPAVTPPLTSIPADTALAVLDIPALTDSADSLVYYTAMSGETDNWQGAVLQQSLDEGASFGVVSDSSVNAIMGTLVEPVSSAAEWYTDTTNAVIVDLFTEDDLESRSDTEFLRGGGAFALSYETGGNLPRWEILQFRDSEQIGPKRWKLTTLHRGVKSTTPIAHAPGDMFVLLDNAVQRHAAESAWIAPEGVAAGEAQLVHRAVSLGQSPEDADVVESLFIGRSQLEWPVAGIEATRAGGVITATVTPRHRFGTPMNPIQSANFTGFDWFVYSYPTPGDPLATATTGPDELTANLNVSGSGWVSVWCIARNRITGLGGVQPTQFPGEPGFSFVILPPES